MEKFPRKKWVKLCKIDIPRIGNSASDIEIDRSGINKTSRGLTHCPRRGKNDMWHICDITMLSLYMHGAVAFASRWLVSRTSL